MSVTAGRPRGRGRGRGRAVCSCGVDNGNHTAAASSTIHTTAVAAAAAVALDTVTARVCAAPQQAGAALLSGGGGGSTCSASRPFLSLIVFNLIRVLIPSPIVSLVPCTTPSSHGACQQRRLPCATAPLAARSAGRRLRSNSNGMPCWRASLMRGGWNPPTAIIACCALTQSLLFLHLLLLNCQYPSSCPPSPSRLPLLPYVTIRIICSRMRDTREALAFGCSQILPNRGLPLRRQELVLLCVEFFCQAGRLP